MKRSQSSTTVCCFDELVVLSVGPLCSLGHSGSLKTLSHLGLHQLSDLYVLSL